MAQVITTILLDDNPKGLRLIEMAGWSGKAFVVPRGKLKELRSRDDANLPGLYILFGETKNGVSAYIGQAENVVSRLMSHDSNRSEDQWNEAVAFVGGLDSAMIKNLESKTIADATTVGRYTLLNGNAPQENKISEAQKIAVDDYRNRLGLIVGLFGYKLFDQQAMSTQADIYYLEDIRNKDASATGSLMDNGEFVVYKGSRFRKEPSKNLESYGPNIVALRAELLHKGVLEILDDHSYRLTSDHIFSSPSQAAATVHGRSCNGWTGWKDEQGKALDENVRQ